MKWFILILLLIIMASCMPQEKIMTYDWSEFGYFGQDFTDPAHEGGFGPGELGGWQPWGGNETSGDWSGQTPVWGQIPSYRKEAGIVPAWFTQPPQKYSQPLSPYAMAMLTRLFEGQASPNAPVTEYQRTPGTPAVMEPAPEGGFPEGYTPKEIQPAQEAQTGITAQTEPLIPSAQWLQRARAAGLLPMLEDYISNVNQMDYQSYMQQAQAHAPTPYKHQMPSYRTARQR
jgi:hypothetical protein